MAGRHRFRDAFQEMAELGLGGLAFRVCWETKVRAGIAAALEHAPPAPPPGTMPAAGALAARLPFDAAGVREVMRGRLGDAERSRLARLASWGAEGRVLAFGRALADYGSPPDWYLNPWTGRRFTPDRHWSRALAEGGRVGDPKLTWELGRFPHAYAMARASAHDAAAAEVLAEALARQVASFGQAAPFAQGLHWASGQEVVIRALAWLFALGAFGPRSPFAEAAPAIAHALREAAVHVERHLGYTRKAVYNNHLVTEALGLFTAGILLPDVPGAARWREEGKALLVEQARRQFYADGGYIQLSHNYERVALQIYLWAVALLRRTGEPVPPEWLAALDRGTSFLHAHQEPDTGWLPNYGSMDGALPSPFTSCDHLDFRPTLQAASIAARGERLHPPGPWDEEAAWLLGPASLDAPLAPRRRASVSFAETGFHVLRGGDERTFATFRCGTIRDRFSQIDMLHLDVWWRGVNVLADAGSYLYNGSAAWHGHFATTGCHNTVAVDGRDQMLHRRRFKNLYWTRARLLRFEDAPGWALAEGEHLGYERHPGGCVHRRAVLFVKDDLWIVVDRVAGEGAHAARLHWLGGEHPAAYDAATGTMSLATPAGEFRVTVLDERGAPLAGDVVAGRAAPPRGWISRHYAEKRPAPSLAVERSGAAPLHFLTLLSGAPAAVHMDGSGWRVAAGGARVSFRVVDGRFDAIRVGSAAEQG
jgi:heparinase II/III-like protein